MSILWRVDSLPKGDRRDQEALALWLSPQRASSSTAICLLLLLVALCLAAGWLGAVVAGR